MIRINKLRATRIHDVIRLIAHTSKGTFMVDFEAEEVDAVGLDAVLTEHKYSCDTDRAAICTAAIKAMRAQAPELTA